MKKPTKIRSNGEVDCSLEWKSERELHNHLLQELANVIVEGESMEPYLKDGDQIQCNHDVPKDGQLVVAKLNDGRLFVARYERRSKGITLRFENQMFGPVTFPCRDFAFIAKVYTILRNETRK